MYIYAKDASDKDVARLLINLVRVCIQLSSLLYFSGTRTWQDYESCGE